MTRQTIRKIQAFKVRDNHPVVNGRVTVYKASTTIPVKELVDWVGEDGDPLMVRVAWKRESYLIWKDDWEAASEV